MPSKSKAQFHKMGLLYKQGKISRETLEEFNKGVHPNALPEHVGARSNPLAGKRKKHASRT
jgi:hypothetical protein